MLTIFAFESWLKNHTCLSSITSQLNWLLEQNSASNANSVNRFEISTSKNLLDIWSNRFSRVFYFFNLVKYGLVGIAYNKSFFIW